MKTIKVDLSALPERTNKAYYPLYFNTKRWNILVGGAGSGKSEFEAAKQLILCVKNRRERRLVARKVAATIKKSVFQLICDIIDRWNWHGLFKINRGDLSFDCINGARILTTGLDDREKLKSITGITGGWIEEATECTEDDVDQFNLRIRGDVPGVMKEVALTLNPISVAHWIKKRFFDKRQDDVEILKTTYKDNRFIDAEYKSVLDGLAETNPAMYRIYGLGEWGRLEGLIYDAIDLLTAWPDHFDETIYGLDFGFNNPMALVQENLYDGEIWEKELLYESGLTTPMLIERLPDLGVSKSDPIYADASEPDRISEIKKAGYNIKPCKKGPGSVQAGISFVKSQKMHGHRGNTNLIKEESAYAWKVDKDGQPMDEPVKFSDHGMDARRYAIYTHLAHRQEPRIHVF